MKKQLLALLSAGMLLSTAQKSHAYDICNKVGEKLNIYVFDDASDWSKFQKASGLVFNLIDKGTNMAYSAGKTLVGPAGEKLESAHDAMAAAGAKNLSDFSKNAGKKGAEWLAGQFIWKARHEGVKNNNVNKKGTGCTGAAWKKSSIQRQVKGKTHLYFVFMGESGINYGMYKIPIDETYIKIYKSKNKVKVKTEAYYYTEPKGSGDSKYFDRGKKYTISKEKEKAIIDQMQSMFGKGKKK